MHWVLATNSDFFIHLSLQPNVVLLDSNYEFCSIKYHSLKNQRFTYLSLFQRLNSFTNCNKKIRNFQFCSNFQGKLHYIHEFIVFLVYCKVINMRCSFENWGAIENNFSLKIRPELKIANFHITLLRIFCDSVILWYK